jgi:hypothetical protein
MSYDLGPAATKGAFVKFQLSGHEGYGDEPDAILQYVNGARQIVSEIPPALVKVNGFDSVVVLSRMRTALRLNRPS